MQLNKWAVIAVTVCLFGGHAYSQSADDIINKNLDALGGKSKLSTITTLYQESNSSLGGNDMTGKTWIRFGTGMRQEIEAMGSQIVTVIYKDSGWAVNPLAGSTDPQPIPAEQIKRYAGMMTPGGMFANYQDKGYTATLVGHEAVNGKDCFKIKLSKKDDPDMLFWIDASSYMIDKQEVTSNMGGQDMTVDIAFTDYKTTPEGFMIPYTVTTTLPMGDLETKLTKVVVNGPVSDSVFTKP